MRPPAAMDISENDGGWTVPESLTPAFLYFLKRGGVFVIALEFTWPLDDPVPDAIVEKNA